VYKAAVSVGYNPTFKGAAATKHKMIEPYLLHEFPEDFYGADIRLIVCGYAPPPLLP
jgi:riboflavin kinase